MVQYKILKPTKGDNHMTVNMKALKTKAPQNNEAYKSQLKNHNPNSYYNTVGFRANSPCLNCPDRFVKMVEKTDSTGKTVQVMSRCHDTCERFIEYDKTVTAFKNKVQEDNFKQSLPFIYKNRRSNLMFYEKPKKWYEK